jgi:hypothetical protein
VLRRDTRFACATCIIQSLYSSSTQKQSVMVSRVFTDIPEVAFGYHGHAYSHARSNCTALESAPELYNKTHPMIPTEKQNYNNT